MSGEGIKVVEALTSEVLTSAPIKDITSVASARPVTHARVCVCVRTCVRACVSVSVSVSVCVCMCVCAEQ